jgi:serine/threonine protein kinase
MSYFSFFLLKYFKIKFIQKMKINKIINNYKLLQKLGEGSFGSVYKVENIQNKEM